MSIKAVKAVLFDLDETLWPVGPVIQHAEATLFQWMAVNTPQVAQNYSIERMRSHRQQMMQSNPRFQYDLWALRHAMLVRLFAEFGEDAGKADQAMAVFADARNKVELFEDVLPALDKLGQRVIMGSVSNGFADLKAIGLAPYFKVSIAAHTFGCAKPDPRIFAAACKALQLSPREIVFVGDDLLLDVEGAQKAGMQAVWVDRQQLQPHEIPYPHVKPDAVISELGALLEWL
ncbi:HAD family hydrolase [Undibacterium sp.]|uniref:HAD family hydrolase n=1 Tax=Undibacterium sp. TaxID=1914977 RepID=UPI002B71045F|nr:HAD family hydrolase [Undibacterium sp.]HTD03568.1 HAD family hydrolase [Undibacterium sp.]